MTRPSKEYVYWMTVFIVPLLDQTHYHNHYGKQEDDTHPLHKLHKKLYESDTGEEGDEEAIRATASQLL